MIEKVKHYHQDFEVHKYWCAQCRKYSRGIFDPRFYDAEVLDAFVVWAQEFLKQREAQHGRVGEPQSICVKRKWFATFMQVRKGSMVATTLWLLASGRNSAMSKVSKSNHRNAKPLSWSPS